MPGRKAGCDDLKEKRGMPGKEVICETFVLVQPSLPEEETEHIQLTYFLTNEVCATVTNKYLEQLEIFWGLVFHIQPLMI